MPVYGFRCRDCNTYGEVTASIHDGVAVHVCRFCGGQLRRVFHPPAVVRGLVSETHFNHAVGRVVHNSSDFRSALAQKADEMSERLGYEQRYAPVDPRDHEPPGAREQLRKRQLEREGAIPKTVFA